MTRPRALASIGYAIALWSLLFMLLHVYMAVSGTAPASMFRPGARAVEHFREINWIAAFMMGAAALLGVLVSRRDLGSVARPIVAALLWLGCSIAAAHGIVGIATRLRDLLAAAQARGAWLFWDLLLFEPWFLIEGMLLGAAGWYLMSSRTAKRQWAIACLAGVGIGIVTAILGVRID